MNTCDEELLLLKKRTMYREEKNEIKMKYDVVN